MMEKTSLSHFMLIIFAAKYSVQYNEKILLDTSKYSAESLISSNGGNAVWLSLDIDADSAKVGYELLLNIFASHVVYYHD